ncbi:hypothetical protein H257_16121 [Aphanomyces astaci]|uniref:Uncharacterized protein n=1 Tax=Aphanomyces astaci TaxID=112090 RepID=W4FJR9_APHAT|nr:hypothetical protein H257_16121 [Aphanomyces astaci]ETV67762.1 hypothetical protein H257_16121 [Aphanomyces astaci]|eukprot:XP_009842755.1 hypothetical protein H257_16121 [Aphanomyces astaci]
MVRLYPTVMRFPGSSIPWEIHSNPKLFPFSRAASAPLTARTYRRSLRHLEQSRFEIERFFYPGIARIPA